MPSRSDRWPAAFEGWAGAAKPPDYEEAYSREFTWVTPSGSTRTIRLDLPVALYEYCTNRARIQEYGVYISDPLQEPMLESILEEIRRVIADETSLLDGAVRFVQSLEYTRDTDDTGHLAYPKYPIETLVHEQGDCEDGTILLGALLNNAGYDVTALVFPNEHHMLLGVSLPDHSGVTVQYEGTEYFPVETTATDWQIGAVPSQYRNAAVEFHLPTNQPILLHEWEATPGGTHQIDVSLTVANFGSAAAPNVGADLLFRRRDQELEGATVLMQNATIPAGRNVSETGSLRMKPTHKLQGVCRLSIDGRLHDRSESDWHSA
ncbi:MAG: hypothetical protein ABEJ60_04650 [Halodesulfurarchaeum sp.]